MRSKKHIVTVRLDAGAGHVVERTAVHEGYFPEDHANEILREGLIDKNGLEAVTYWSPYRVISVKVKPA